MSERQIVQVSIPYLLENGLKAAEFVAICGAAFVSIPYLLENGLKGLLSHIALTSSVRFNPLSAGEWFKSVKSSK